MAVLADRTPLPARVLPSYAVELMWAFEAASNDESIESTPLYKNLYADAALRERAHRLFDDSSPVSRRAHLACQCRRSAREQRSRRAPLQESPSAVATPHEPMRLATESADDRAILHARLASLIEDAELRERYLFVLGEVSAAARGAMGERGSRGRARRGRTASRRARPRRHLAANPRAQLPEDAAPSSTASARTSLPSGRSWSRARSRARVRLSYSISPAASSSGVSARRDDAINQKAHAELARRLKAVADPTRLALLVRLSS